MSEGSNHRTRDRDGKYIRKTADSDISRLTSQVFIGEDGQLQRLRSPDQNRKKSIARREDTKVKEKESEACLPDHGRRRSTKGYCPFRFTLSAPITKCPEVVLPTEFHPKAIHVEDVFIQTNHATFRDSFCGQQALNEIWFTEGAIIECEDIKLSTGKCFRRNRTFTEIQSFELQCPVEGGFKQIQFSVPCNIMCGPACQKIFLLESNRFCPSPIQWWPFIIDSSDEDCITATPERRGRQPVPIPCDFCPTDMLILPPLGPEQIADFINESVSGIRVTFRSGSNDYEVFNESSQTCTTIKNIFPKQSEFFIARVTPRKFDGGAELAPEIQRAMNPPLVTKKNNNITIDGVVVSVTIREYPSAELLAEELSERINHALRWETAVCKISVCYDRDCGKFMLQRIAPFRMQFGENSLKDILGFSDITYAGNYQYLSSFSVFYVTVDRSCRHRIPSNRYLAQYDKVNDQISIQAISKAEYMRLLICDFCPDDCYRFTPGHNFALPFFLLCNSPLTSFLGFQEKSCFLEWTSSVGVSEFLGPPPILYLIIPELENDILVERSVCGGSFRGAMAVLYIESNGRAYKSRSLHPCDLTEKKNVSGENLCRLTIKFFTESGIEFCLSDARAVINFRISV